MGLITKIERSLERTVNSAFARTFRSGVQPVEIAAALKREIDIKAVTLDRDRVVAPSIFTVKLAKKDAAELAQHGSMLTAELTQLLTDYAAAQDYQLQSPIAVVFKTDESVTAGTVEVAASKPDAGTRWQPVLQIGGESYQITKQRTVVGRGSDSDVRITDNAASRKHLEIIWNGRSGTIRDMGSTNGSKFNGQRFKEIALRPDTVVYVGKTALRFRLLPVIAESGAL